MDQDQARQYVIDNVSVTRDRLLLMKSLVLKHYNANTTVMIEGAIRELGAEKPAEVVLHPTIDPLPALRQFTEWISLWIAGCEALWQLVYSGVVIPAAGHVNDFSADLGWTTIIPGSGGERAGWRFPELKTSYPHLVSKARAAAEPEVLSDPDLFLNEIKIRHIHAEVEEALRFAVRCFRSELYVPALVMLGKASEGAWIEMGVALLAALPEDERQKHEKQRLEWSGPDVGFAKKSRDILKFFESKQQHLRPISKTANVRLDDLRLALLWSDAVREVRNVVHHGSELAIRASYETTSTLLMSAVLHLKTLYRLYSGAVAATTSSSRQSK